MDLKHTKKSHGNKYRRLTDVWNSLENAAMICGVWSSKKLWIRKDNPHIKADILLPADYIVRVLYATVTQITIKIE